MTDVSDALPWCAVDLSPGQARAWLLQGGAVSARATLVPPPEAPEPQHADALIKRLGGPADGAPVVICGLAGSPAPVAVPAQPGQIQPQRLTGSTAHALPGLRQNSPPALMQGDEVRIAGFLALNPGWDGVICLSGALTHWAQVSAEEVVSFQSFLTGATADALTAAPLLHALLTGTEWDDDAFADALDTAMSRPERLASGLAEIRAMATLEGLPGSEARARLHGLLIGAELAAARPYWLGQQVALIAPDDTAARYAAALARQGVPVTCTNEERMTLAGFAAARQRIAAA